jgi:signal transduction histidine kinase
LLDWDRLSAELKDAVREAFPEAVLLPQTDPAAAGERTMTALPVTLEPGPAPTPPPPGWTTLRLGLLAAWLAAALALAGVAFAGRALLDLSERRIRFVSAVTHELRTPLTSLRLYLDLLVSGMVSDEVKQREYLTTLHGESERLNRLIENVLNFARLEKRSVRANKQSVSIDDLLADVKLTWGERTTADGKQLEVISTLPPGHAVLTDGRMAAQVLGNLIDNAKKYTRGAADNRIWVWAKPAGRCVAFEVEDRGPGVPAADRPGLFRPFRRGRDADTTAGGAGLGLALAKQWAELLGGTLDYRPAEGGTGSVFRFLLPQH